MINIVYKWEVKNYTIQTAHGFGNLIPCGVSECCESGRNLLCWNSFVGPGLFQISLDWRLWKFWTKKQLDCGLDVLAIAISFWNDNDDDSDIDDDDDDETAGLRQFMISFFETPSSLQCFKTSRQKSTLSTVWGSLWAKIISRYLSFSPFYSSKISYIYLSRPKIYFLSF